MSKKAEQRKIREEKQAAAQRREALTGILLKSGAAILLVLAVVVFSDGLYRAAQTPAPDEVTADDHVRGNPDAAVTLTVYADFQCPACLTETNLIARAWPRISDRVKLVFRHYPLDIHQHAFLAARFAEAAARQDAFWPMHDILYANQTLWSNSVDAATLFTSYATQLGLDTERLTADIDAPEVRERILNDQRGGTRAGVRSTPTLYLNGRMLLNNPRTVNELVELVEDATGG